MTIQNVYRNKNRLWPTANFSNMYKRVTNKTTSKVISHASLWHRWEVPGLPENNFSCCFMPHKISELGNIRGSPCVGLVRSSESEQFRMSLNKELKMIA